MLIRVLSVKVLIYVIVPERTVFFILRVLGCLCFVYNHGLNVKKLDFRTIKIVFLDYSPTQKGYKSFDPVTRKRYVSKDVTIIESAPYFSEFTPI